MKVAGLLGVVGLLTVMVQVEAATRYVWTNSPAPEAPYTNWAMAAHVIQDAIDEAVAGDTIMVTNGIYDVGGRAAPDGEFANRVYIDKPVTVIGVNGSDFTFIQGTDWTWQYQPLDVPLYRGVYLSSNACLSGFTISKGRVTSNSWNAGGENGGGAYCQSGSTLINCVISNNVARNGGGIYVEPGALVDRCIIRGNWVPGLGGGVYGSAYAGYYGDENGGGTLRNCLVVDNNAESSQSDGSVGGVYGVGLVENCTIGANRAENGEQQVMAVTTVRNSIGGTWSAQNFVNCYTGNPIYATAYHLAWNSPCIDAAFQSSWSTGSLDLAGNPRIYGVGMDIGCYEYHPTGSLAVAFTVCPPQTTTGFLTPWQVTVSGNSSILLWDFGDGVRATNLLNLTHTFSQTGSYAVAVIASNLTMSAVSTSFIQVVTAGTVYVKTNGNDGADGRTWSTAKATIQAAVDVAIMGETVLVTNGVYSQSGGLTNYPIGSLTPNCIVVNHPIRLRSVGGAAVTTVSGLGVNRCIYLGNDAEMDGFTLTGGSAVEGGGVYGEGSAVVSNCVISDCSASWHGGGIYSGVVVNCTIVSSTGYYGGGAYASTLYRSTVQSNRAVYGGGISDGKTYFCRLLGNKAHTGGGAIYSTVYNSLIAQNWANYGTNLPGMGGASHRCDLFNSTIVNNSASSSEGGEPGVTYATLVNCILSGNIQDQAAPTYDSGFVDSLNGDYHLSAASPYRDAGNNAGVVGDTDLDGNARIVNGQVDLGAYEFTSPAVADANGNGIPNEWETQYFGGPTNANSGADTDGDCMSNWEEWRAGTDPLNDASCFAFEGLAASTNGTRVFTWPSRSNRFYSVWCSTSLTNAGGFMLLNDDIMGTPPMNTYTDTLHGVDAQLFYRIRVNN